MLGDATLASAAMLAAQRCTDHTRYAKVRLVILPFLNEVVDDGLLLSDAVQFRDEPRVIDHGTGVEESSESKGYREDQVPQQCPFCRERQPAKH